MIQSTKDHQSAKEESNPNPKDVTTEQRTLSITRKLNNQQRMIKIPNVTSKEPSDDPDYSSEPQSVNTHKT